MTCPIVATRDVHLDPQSTDGCRPRATDSPRHAETASSSWHAPSAANRLMSRTRRIDCPRPGRQRAPRPPGPAGARRRQASAPRRREGWPLADHARLGADASSPLLVRPDLVHAPTEPSPIRPAWRSERSPGIDGTSSDAGSSWGTARRARLHAPRGPDDDLGARLRDNTAAAT